MLPIKELLHTPRPPPLFWLLLAGGEAGNAGKVETDPDQEMKRRHSVE